MNNVSHKNRCYTSAVQIHVDPLPINQIKSKLDLKTEGDYLKIKLRRNSRPDNRKCMNSKWLFLAMMTQKGYFCLYEISR